jgi:predicted TIM-barrel fold metal-dependent hydrolase
MPNQFVWCASQTRRDFLGGLAAIGAGMLASGCQTPAPGSAVPASSAVPANPRLIDVHHHFASPGWIKMLRNDGVLNPGWEGFTPAKAIDLMDKSGTATAISSPTTPGVWFAEGYGNSAAGLGAKSHTIEESRVLVREMNEFGAKMVSDYKGRFGILAALALPDIDGSLKAIEHALDMLKLQGIGLLTSYGNRWLGDPMFAPVFEELNRRKAVVYTHPTAAPCCRALLPGVAPTTIEYSTDTARAIVSWIESGSAKRFPDIRWIHSHGGGTLVAIRFLGDEAQNPRAEAPPDSKLSYLRKYYYDTAGGTASNVPMLGALKELVGPSQMVWGFFDIPGAYGQDAGASFREMGATGKFTEAELRGIERENALKLFPQFA